MWEGSLKQGSGVMAAGSGAFKSAYSFATRFEDSPGTNPEELIGAAHAGCFSMALSMFLEKAGYTPVEIHTTAEVNLEKSGDGFSITRITLKTEAQVEGIDAADLERQARAAKENCPVSQALAGTDIRLEAALKG
jgi:osmotically inducible protein OsmC